MTEPVIAQKEPCGVDVEEGNEYWWCACGKRHRAFAYAVCRQAKSDGMVLRLQKDDERADL
jgi:hypothetical protein